MADFTTYRQVENDESVSTQPPDLAVVDGPASFLALAVEMGVPIISRVKAGTGGMLTIGGGLSFAVARTVTAISLRKGIDWANETPADWFDRVQSKSNDPEDIVVVKNHVNKRILLPRSGSRDASKNDANIFSAVTNEIRILAHEGVRKSLNIISLVAISWNARETGGRFLPEILLEGAKHGSVSQYLQVSPGLDFRSKALMLVDIAAGLAFLHENGIVHCDVKPSNMLVCDSPQRADLTMVGMAPVIVRLCDFGCSVILSDYPRDHRFSIAFGTPGWMAPEIEQGLPIDSELLFKTDVYSLGLVAAYIFSGTRSSSDFYPTSEIPGKNSNRSYEMVTAVKSRLGDFDEDEAAHGRKKKRKSSEAGAGITITNGQAFESSIETYQLASLPTPPSSSSANGPAGETLSPLLRQVLARTSQANPVYRRNAKDIYRICAAFLLRSRNSWETGILR